MKSTRIEKEIDLLKFTACILVVILHVFEPSKNILHESIYLIGTFGIPLFFMVNGYLRADKSFTFEFVFKICFRYAKFIFIWSLLVSGVKYSILHKFELGQLIMLIFVGKGDLFHLWFLIGIVILYFAIACGEMIAKRFGRNINNIIASRESIYIISVLFIIVFCFSILMMHIASQEIRHIIFPCFRIITNGGYFILGMMIGKQMIPGEFKKWYSYILLATYSISVAASYISGMIYASSFYDFIPVTMGTLIIFVFIRDRFKGKISRRMAELFSTSTGVWILHPFVLRGLNKIARLLLGDIPIVIRLGEIVVTVCVCIGITCVFNKVRWLRFLLNP